MVQKHETAPAQQLFLQHKQKQSLATPQTIVGVGKSICMLLGQSDFNCTNRILEAFILTDRQWMLYRYCKHGLQD